MIDFKTFMKEESSLKKPTDEIAPSHARHASLSHHYDFPFDHKHVTKYTQSSDQVNGYLWHKHKNPWHLDPRQDFNARMLSHDITQNEAPHDLTVHSGLSIDPRKHMNSEGIVHHPAFLSTSIDPSVARQFARRNSLWPPHPDANQSKEEIHTMQIHIPKGSKHGSYIGHLSQNKTEREFLIDKGKNLKIHHTEENKYKSPSGKSKSITHFIHHATIGD